MIKIGPAYPTPAEAAERAECDADLFSGVVAYGVVIEADTGREVEEPKLIARFGQVAKGCQDS